MACWLLVMDDLVSIIIPTYNRAAMVEQAVASALNQTHRNIEIIVVDDGSTDDTATVMSRLIDERVRYIRREQNRGAQAARNAGVTAARGSLIAFLDSDDTWDARKIAIQAEKLIASGTEVGMVYCGIRRIDSGGRKVPDRVPRHRGNLFEVLLKHNVIGGMSTAMIRAEVLADVGPFDERLRARQDLDMWLRIARRYEIDYVEEKLVTYVMHRGRTSENKSARLQGTLALLGKLHDDLKDRPRARAIHYYALARLYAQRGESTQARRYLKRSLSARFSFRTLAQLARSALRSA